MQALKLSAGADLSIGAAAALRERWLAQIDAAPSEAPLHLALDGVAECDSAGVQLLLALRHSAQAEGRPLQLAGSSPAVREALGTFGLQGLLAEHGAAT